MRRMAMLFALITIISSMQHIFASRRLFTVSTKVVGTFTRVRRFLDRQIKLLPARGASLGLVHN